MSEDMRGEEALRVMVQTMLNHSIDWIKTNATARAAVLLRMEDQTGKIAEGLDADLLVVDRNPLEDIGAVHDPLLIINNGKIIINRLEWKVGQDKD